MFSKFRPVIFLLPFIGVVLLLAQTTAQSQKEQERESADFLQLNRQIFARYDDPESGKVRAPDQVKIIEAKLRATIQGGIAQALKTPNPVAGDITAAIARIQGELTFGRGDLIGAPGSGADLTNAPFAEFSQLNLGPTLAVAYIIPEGGQGIPDSQPFIEFYTREDETWNLMATVDSDFKASTLFISPINAGLAGENWYLAWGKNIGDSVSRLNIRLYAFDGSKVRTVWKRDDLAHGLIQVSGSSVTLDYRTGGVSAFEKINETHEVLNVTANGLQ